jgi:hypothetical protein
MTGEKNRREKGGKKRKEKKKRARGDVSSSVGSRTFAAGLSVVTYVDICWIG